MRDIRILKKLTLEGVTFEAFSLSSGAGRIYLIHRYDVMERNPHKVRRFESQDKMLGAFPGSDDESAWLKTDPSLGYHLRREEYARANVDYQVKQQRERDRKERKSRQLE